MCYNLDICKLMEPQLKCLTWIHQVEEQVGHMYRLREGMEALQWRGDLSPVW